MPQDFPKLEPKEEVVEDENDEECIASVAAKKKLTSDATQKSRSNVKKEVSSVKKEEADEDYEKPSLKKAFGKIDNKNKLTTQKSQAKVKKEVRSVKKEEADDDYVKPSLKKASGKIDNKKKNNEGAKKKKRRAEKKVFDLPGQKRDPPEERDPSRIFYESLSKQRPSSEMATIWMMESGLLPKEVARKVFEKKQKFALHYKPSSPSKTLVSVKKKTKSVTVVKKTSTSVTSVQKKNTPGSGSRVAAKQAKKRKRSDDDDDESFEDDSDGDFVESGKKEKKQTAS